MGYSHTVTTKSEDFSVCVFSHSAFGAHSHLLIHHPSQQAFFVNIGNEAHAVAAWAEEHTLAATELLQTHGFLEYMEGQEDLREHFDVVANMSPYDEFWLAHLDTQAQVLNASRIPFPFIDQQVIPNDPIKLGVAGKEIVIQSFHTPGNTPGATCYYIEEAGIVFTGDTLYKGDVGPVDIPHGSIDKLKASVAELLFTLPDDTVVLPGRGPETTIGAEKSENTFIPRKYGKAHIVPVA